MVEPVWGVNPVLELLKRKPEKVEEIYIDRKHLSGKVYQILERARKHNIPVKISSRENFSPPKIPPHVKTQGVVAYLREFPYASLEDIEERYIKAGEKPLIVMLDEIEDPQNVGAILRVSDAVGAHGVIIPKHRSCEITGTVIKVSAGSAFNIPIVKVTNLKEAILYFRKREVWIVGLTHRAEKTIYELPGDLPLLLIAGNEERGIRPTIVERCDFLAKIPMRGLVESLNVAQAVGIALYEIIRQRYFQKQEASPTSTQELSHPQLR